jgi:hypothetical protein
MKATMHDSALKSRSPDWRILSLSILPEIVSRVPGTLFPATEAAREQPTTVECTSTPLQAFSRNYLGLSHAEILGRTSKMSHDLRWRGSCDITIWILLLHFDQPYDSTRRDGCGRWLWRLVRHGWKRGCWDQSNARLASKSPEPNVWRTTDA